MSISSIYDLPAIKVFAIDHRKNISWKLPFTRLGKYKDSDAVINDGLGNSISKHELPFAENDGIYWAWKNQKELGKIDYIGFCHYRRFFTIASHDVFIEQIDPPGELVMTPNQQLALMMSQKVDILVRRKENENFTYNPASKNYRKQAKFAWESTWLQLNADGYNLSQAEVEQIYKSMLEFAPNSMKEAFQKAFQHTYVHFCCMFTMRMSLFNVFSEIIWKTMFSWIKTLERERVLNDNCRMFGMLMERLISCIIDAFVINGYEALELPIVTTAYNAKLAYRTQTCKEKGMKVDLERFKNDFQI